MIDESRLTQSQAILKAFAPGVRMWWDRGFVFAWESSRGVVTQKHWRAMSKGSFYPRWHFPFGGTCTTATFQLMRWAKREPVLPLRQWRYWCGPSVAMNPKAAELATEFGWPESVPCVFCGKLIGPSDRLDWYGYGLKIPGPGCWAANFSEGIFGADRCTKKAVPA